MFFQLPLKRGKDAPLEVVMTTAAGADCEKLMEQGEIKSFMYK
jgi:hypothetical protein